MSAPPSALARPAGDSTRRPTTMPRLRPARAYCLAPGCRVALSRVASPPASACARRHARREGAPPMDRWLDDLARAVAGGGISRRKLLRRIVPGVLIGAAGSAVARRSAGPAAAQ